ncbi:MAG: hypothetical protein IT503_01990 [Burkholderiaceae bacterium]|nr:MAG: hypothetical protein F9K36_00435 [Burkholderiaceae bacterium]MCC7284928.1 hypothetical protein [Burkholderiaceae bacterium]
MTKPADAADPMELVGVPVPGGDVHAMVRCLVEEFVLLGWDEQRVMQLFARPCFAAPHRIYRERGAEYVRSIIREVAAAWTPDSSREERSDA